MVCNGCQEKASFVLNKNESMTGVYKTAAEKNKSGEFWDNVWR